MKTENTIRDLFAFGGDSDGEDDQEKIKEVPVRKPNGQFASKSADDDDDDDDDDEFIPDPKDRKIKKLSRENNRRRISNREMTEAMKAKDQEIADLRKELGKANRLQKKFDELTKEHNSQLGTVRRMAIRQAIEQDKLEDGTKRSWYDVNMVEALLKDDELAVDLSDFTVGGLEEQLSAIAEEKPFLVKSGSENRQEERRSNTQPSGFAPQSSATGSMDQQGSSEEEQMVRDFPALGLQR
jgi:DNA gyrase/topoisomerase IV subunit A